MGVSPQPNIFVIVGPGGVGKGTVVARLIDRDPHLWLSRSWTTRARRPGEPADAYRFVGRDEFAAQVERDGFLEHADFLGNLYGTPVPDPPNGHDVVLEIDVQGARQVVERFSDACVVYIDAPSMSELERRLVGRGDAEDSVRRRLAHASTEAAAATPLATHWVVNDEVDATVAAIERIIVDRRSQRL